PGRRRLDGEADRAAPAPPRAGPRGDTSCVRNRDTGRRPAARHRPPPARDPRSVAHAIGRGPRRARIANITTLRRWSPRRWARPPDIIAHTQTLAPRSPHEPDATVPMSGLLAGRASRPG